MRIMRLLIRILSAGLIAILLGAFAALAKPVKEDAKEIRPVVKDDTLIGASLSQLKKDVSSGNKAALDAFWARVAKEGSPLIEPSPGDEGYSLVTFLYHGKDDTRNVVVFGGVAGTDLDKMNHLEGTDVWYLTYKVRNDARFTYDLSPNDALTSLIKMDMKDMKAIMKRISTFAPDPLNPHKFIGMPVPSTVELPGAPPQNWITLAPGVTAGKVEEKKFKSTIMKNERNIWVYTPAGYDPRGPDYGLMVLFDGVAFKDWVPTPVILDNMIAKGLIPPMVAIILDNPTPVSRNTELPCNADFADFLAKEVVPWMRQNYHATSDPSRVVVAGSSYGGLASTYAALRHPEVFGNVLSQSGSYWWAPDGSFEPEWLTKEFVKSPKLPVKFYLDVGLMEVGSMPNDAPTQVAVNRHMRDVLQAKGYSVTYREFNGAHEYYNWRGTLSDGLLALIGKQQAASASGHK